MKQVVGHGQCEPRLYADLLCSEPLRGKSPGYDKTTCPMLEAMTPRVEGQLIAHVFAKWTPGSETVTGNMTAGDLQALSDCGIGGQVDVHASGTNYYGRQPTKVIVLLKEPVIKPIRFKIPKHTVGIYVQRDAETFTACDAAMSTVDQFIRLHPAGWDSSATLYEIESPDGSTQGGTAATW